MAKVKICVTQEDIDLGTPGIGDKCAIARACKRQFPEIAENVHVNSVEIQRRNVKIEGFFHNDGRETLAILPTEARRFIRNYDRTDPRTFAYPVDRATIHPFDFEVELPDDIAKGALACQPTSVNEPNASPNVLPGVSTGSPVATESTAPTSGQ